jgi:hypothetical protein
MTPPTKRVVSLSHLYADSIEKAISRAGLFRPVNEIVRSRVTTGHDKGRLFDAIDLLIKADRVDARLIDGVPSIGPRDCGAGG